MNKYGPFTFKVTFFDYDYNEVNTQGVLFAESFAEAAAKIEKSFKDTLISIDSLYGLEPNDLLFFEDTRKFTADEVIEMIKVEN